MDKIEEIKHVRAVYGAQATIEPVLKEPPDFALIRNENRALGIEVRELYTTETDARLRKMAGYAQSLIDGGPVSHKDDSKHLDISEFTLTDEAGNVKGRGTGIMQQIPSLRSRADMLASAVQRKESDLASYAKKWPHVDLVIKDGSNMFWFDDFQRMHFVFSQLMDRALLTRSRFREAFLITRRKDSSVYVPLRLNVFAEDAFIVESKIYDLLQRPLLPDASDTIAVFAHCMTELGYGAVQLTAVEGKVALVVGAHLYLIGAQGEKNVRNYAAFPDHMPTGAPLRTLGSGLSSEMLKVCKVILADRPELVGLMELVFPTRTGDE